MSIFQRVWNVIRDLGGRLVQVVNNIWSMTAIEPIYRAFPNSPLNEEGVTSIDMPVMDSIQYSKFTDIYPQVVVIESRPVANMPSDGSDITQQGM